MSEFTVAITGASGSACARGLLGALSAHPDVRRINAVISSSALTVAREELGPRDASLDRIRARLCEDTSKIRWFDERDVGAPIASGSYRQRGTVILPCSMSTLGAVASGASHNLIHRAAEVTLKERRLLVLGVREAPLSAIHLRNMLTVTQAGAVVLPITPAFYGHPRTIDDVIELYLGRVLDHLGLPQSLGKRWGS
ncbi:MAG: UbiX family flavin prenyltransferase [Acidobacteriota bacterium]